MPKEPDIAGGKKCCRLFPAYYPVLFAWTSLLAADLLISLGAFIPSDIRSAPILLGEEVNNQLFIGTAQAAADFPSEVHDDHGMCFRTAF